MPSTEEVYGKVVRVLAEEVVVQQPSVKLSVH
jgi:hypothetical protein